MTTRKGGNTQLSEHDESALVERSAFLFEAGDYPDKGISVSEEDLEKMAARFGQPCPIQMEHQPGPLRFGWLVRVWREGRRLLGRLVFSSAAWRLVEQSGAGAVSLGLDRDTLDIREVSLVRNPRVAGARVFSDGDGLVQMDAREFLPIPAAEDAVARMSRELSGERARAEVDDLVRQGRVAPAARQAALDILASEGLPVVGFADGKAETAAEAFRRFLQMQPPVVLFGEMAAAGSGQDAAEAPDALLQALGITRDDLKRVSGADGKEKA